MPFLFSLLALLLILVPGHRARAHEVPATVVVRTFVKPEGARVRLLVRVPLESMRDVSFPSRGAGLLDVARAEPTLRDAAQLWIADGVRLRVGDRALGAPQVVRSVPRCPAIAPLRRTTARCAPSRRCRSR
jgi:hypothetical protein